MSELNIDLRVEPLPAEFSELRQEVRGFLREELEAGRFEPKIDSWLRGFDRDFSRRLGSRGWVGMTLPTQYGGHGRSQLERFVVVEELLAAGAPVASHWVADRQIAHSILNFGSEKLKQKYLPAIASGGFVVGAGYSEPDVGSDLASVRTRGERIDGGWRLTGTKIWTSHGHHADFFVILCRTSPLEKERHAGLSVMLVDSPNSNLHVRPILLMTGEHHFNEMVLDGVEVPDDMVLGEVGKGWSIMTADLALERSGPERFLSTYRLLVEMARRASDANDASARRAVAELFARLWTLRSMSLAVAITMDRGRSPNVEAAVVKDMGTRFEKDVGEVARQIFTAEADIDATDPFIRHLGMSVMHSPAYSLRGGANEILRGIIARGIGLR